MAVIKPFRGIRYNVPGPSLVVSQPYDRVRYGLQQQYYDLSPYNVVRITRGVEMPADRPQSESGPNVYTRARDYFDRWRADGVLAQDDQPALYAYHQTFRVGELAVTRKGFVAALELSPFDAGIVLPHERTHAGPKMDRLRLLRALQVNMGQIFMLYPDPENQVREILDRAISGQAPAIDTVEMFEKDVQQQLWVVTDQAAIAAVQHTLAPKRNLIIADGHHRYETALNYQHEMRGRHPDAPPNAAFNYRMTSMVSMDDPGLIILPTHREVFDWPHASGSQVLARARENFEVLPVSDLASCLEAAKANEQRHAIGFYDGSYYVLLLKPSVSLDREITGSRSLAWKSLDVSILHKLVLEPLVGLSEEAIDGESHIRYHRDPTLAIQNVTAGRGNYVFLLNGTRIDQVRACAQKGEKMPQKSTDFYPKMITGLTMMEVGAEQVI